MSEHVTELITDETSTIAIRRDLNQEIAAIAMAILDKEGERTEWNKRANTDLKKLKKRLLEVAHEIKAGGNQVPFQFEAMTQRAANDGHDEEHDDDEQAE